MLAYFCKVNMVRESNSCVAHSGISIVAGIMAGIMAGMALSLSHANYSVMASWAGTIWLAA